MVCSDALGRSCGTGTCCSNLAWRGISSSTSWEVISEDKLEAQARAIVAVVDIFGAATRFLLVQWPRLPQLPLDARSVVTALQLAEDRRHQHRRAVAPRARRPRGRRRRRAAR